MVDDGERPDPAAVGVGLVERAFAAVGAPAADRPVVAGADDQGCAVVVDDGERQDPAAVGVGDRRDDRGECRAAQELVRQPRVATQRATHPSSEVGGALPAQRSDDRCSAVPRIPSSVREGVQHADPAALVFLPAEWLDCRPGECAPQRLLVGSEDQSRPSEEFAGLPDVGEVPRQVREEVRVAPLVLLGGSSGVR